jgi:hypothetical protein
MGRVVLDFSPGAVLEDIDIRVSPLANVGVPGVIMPTAFDFGPDGASFSAPVTLTLTYDDADLPDGIDEGTDLFIVGTSHATGELVPVPGSVVDPIANTVSAPISGFSTHGIAIQCPPNLVLLPWCPPICIDAPPPSPDDPGGEFDPSFGVDGFAELSPAEIDNTPRSITLRTDGRIILVGATTDRGDDDDLFVIRIRPDGEIDRGFGADGIVYLDFGGDEQDGSVAIDDQGRIVVAGTSRVGSSLTGDRFGVVARLLP